MLSRRKNLSRLDIHSSRDAEAAAPSPSRTPGPAKLGLRLILLLLVALAGAALFHGPSAKHTTCTSDDPGSYVPENVPRYHGPSGAAYLRLVALPWQHNTQRSCLLLSASIACTYSHHMDHVQPVADITSTNS